MRTFLFLLLGWACLPLLIILVGAPFNWPTPAPQNFEDSAIQGNTQVLNQSIELNILTYNVANAHGFTTNQRERIKAIADVILELNVDIAGLQEVFIEEDRNFLLDYLYEGGMEYSAEFPAGFLGNGLVIVSKYPIEEHWFHRFKANNPWWKVWEGDWWAGKGIGLARIKIAEKQYVDFYNVHAQAYRGNQASHDVRYLQFQEAAEFVNRASLKNAPVFFVGDFNSEQSFPDYAYLIQHANLMRMMNIDSEIDHITVQQNPLYDFKLTDETEEIYRQILAPYPGRFYSRAPTPTEFFEMYFKSNDAKFLTHISDHPGYLSKIRITPRHINQ